MTQISSVNSLTWCLELNKLRLNVAEVNSTYKIEPEVCLTLQVESQHAVSHFKHPSCTVLEYARDLGNTMHESLKRTSQWSAYYFAHRRSSYPVPENSISLGNRDLQIRLRLRVRVRVFQCVPGAHARLREAVTSTRSLVKISSPS